MRKKLMVVDDEENVLALVSAALEDDERFELLLARGGKEALELARREKPELILLDVLMPEIDGYEVCRRLKEDPETASIKIIMLTALVEESGEMKAKAAGADGYLTKPFSIATLRNTLEEILFGPE